VSNISSHTTSRAQPQHHPASTSLCAQSHNPAEASPVDSGHRAPNHCANNPERYARQLVLPAIGSAGQQRIRAARVAILGIGALGTVSASLLSRAGVGFLRLVDRDYVGLGNLQRGTLFTEDDVRALLPKAVAAQRHLEQVNADVEVKAVCTDINPSSILNLIKDVDLVLDGTDNFELRFLLNEACHKLGIPWVHGAALSTTGTCMTILPQGPCLCCLMPLSPPPGSYETCATAGILGSTTTAVAALQCAEALKLLTGAPVDEGAYRLLDVWNGTLDTIEVQKAPNCKVCGQKDYSRLNKPSGAYCTSLCGRDEIQVVPQVGIQVDLDAIARRLAKLGTVEHTPYLLDFTTDNLSFKLFNDGRALFKDIDDEATAKSLYAEYIGL